MYCYAECHNVEGHNAEGHNAECHNAECHNAECHNAQSHYAECRHAECHLAECHYAERDKAFLGYHGSMEPMRAARQGSFRPCILIEVSLLYIKGK